MGKLYIIPNKDEIEATLDISREYNAHFEYNDFYIPDVLDDDAKVQDLISFYRSLPGDRSQNSLHGAFFDISVHSCDRLIREASDRRIRKSMDIACELGIGSVIFHTNIISNFKTDSYVDGWVNKNAEYWAGLSNDYPDMNIYIENMFDSEPDTLVRLMDKLSAFPRVRACFDYAHAVVFGNDPQKWADKMLPYSPHLHINDNDGITDGHMAIGDGVIDYALLTERIEACGIEPTVLIEMIDPADQRRSIEYLKKNSLYPFSKGGDNNA